MILLLLIGTVVVNKIFIDTTIQTNHMQTQIEKQSYQNNQMDEGIIDLNNLDYTNIQLEKEKGAFGGFLSDFNFKDNLSIVSLLIYSILLSALFTYRERSNRYMFAKQEEKMDRLKIDIVRKQSKINIYDEIEIGLLKYKNLLSPELNLENLDYKISSDSSYVIFSSRVALEKILLIICATHNIDSSSLSEMIVTLYRNRVLNIRANSYAHTIKAFGNRVAHPNIQHPVVYDAKDALLVLSTFLTLLNELQADNLLENAQNAA